MAKYLPIPAAAHNTDWMIKPKRNDDRLHMKLAIIASRQSILGKRKRYTADSAPKANNSDSASDRGYPRPIRGKKNHTNGSVSELAMMELRMMSRASYLFPRMWYSDR